MKKLQLHRIFSFLLACAMVLSLVQPLGAWAISEDTVYIDPTNGADTNAGTEAAPVKTLASAYGKLTQGGKIVFLDDLSITGNTYFPVCAYPVTLTSKTGSEGIITTGTLRMQGNTTFENITVTFNASGLAFISGEGYDLTIGENVTTVNKTGNQVNLVATKRFDATLSANPTLTVKSGKWDYIYATHGNSITGDVTVNIEGGTCTSVSPSYNATVTGNVNISIKNATVSKLYLEPTHKNGNITGAYTVTLGDGANVKASSGDAGVTQNGTTVKVVGNVDSIGTLTGYGEGSNLVLQSGTWKGTAEEFGNVSVDIGAEETLTLSSPITADTVVSAGTLNFDGVGSLIAQTVTGTVNCTITGRVLKNNLYASVPADADLRFPATYGLVNNNGQYMIYDLVNFEGLVVKADEAVKIIFYNDALNNNTTYHGRKDYVIEPYATTEENGVVSYYLPNITGLYCYEASQTGYYTIFQQVYMTEAEAATCTVEEVVMEKRSGEWDLSYYYGQPQEILDAMEPATDKWQTEVPLETPVFTRTDKGAHQMTTQPELEAFIENLDDADDNMYIFSIGKSATYDFDMPIVIFTKADLSAAKTLEQAAELLKQSGIPNVGYKAQMHGDEHAAGEGALGVIKLLDKEENKYLLDSINIFVIPRINPDGGYKDQRNMITRIDETINNYDPNRDMLSLNLQEQRNYLRAIQLLDPIAELDGHERQRNSFVGDIQISMSWQAGTSQALFDLQAEMIQSMFAALEAVDLSGAWYNDYMNTDGVDQTRGYAGSQGRIQFLMETRGIYMGNEAYRSRTASHIVTAMEYLRLCAENATEIQSVVSAAQQSIVTAGETYEDTDTITLAWEGTAKPEFDILTDHYSLEGGEVQTQKAKLYTAKTTRVAPTAYVIPANLEKINLILELMDLQEISYYFLPANTAISLQQYSGTVDENRVTTNVALTEEQSVVFASGAYVFQMNQVNARNLALLMEPDSPSQSDLVQLGRITVGSDGSFPIYRYIHDLKDGKIEYDANGASTLTTVYVSASGSDSNTGAENAPVATLEKAYELLIGTLGGSQNITGTIVLADDYTITASARVDLPAHTFPVKIMGKTAAVKLIFKPTELGESLQQLAFHGPTTLDDLEFRGASTGKLDYIYACGNPFTVGANVTTSAQSSLPILVAGDYRTAAVDTQMTVLGGTWYGVYAGSFRAGHTGTAKLTVNGAKINNFIRGKYAETTSGNFVLDLQNTSFTKFNPGYTGAVSGTITVILREGAEGTIYTNNQSSGNITGTYTVVAAGADLSKVVFENTSDTVTKDVLVFTGGEIAPVAGFSEIHIDTENTVTLTADMTVDQISGGGTVELNGYSLTGDGTYGMDAAVKSVALRPSAAGLYYTGEFKVSEALSGATYGIALSTEDATPVAEDGTTSLYTAGATSVLVKDIMKVGNAENRKNATVRIYARAYIKLEDGTTIYGDTVKVTLRQLVTAIDTKWDGLTELQKTELKAMYATFASDMGHWNIPNLKSAV